MIYDVIGVDQADGDEGYDFFTIGQLIDVLRENPTLIVKFVGTNYTIGELASWRGSYDIPSITYECADRLAGDIALQLSTQLNDEHYGYKGGEYHYHESEEFYVAGHGCAEEYKVISSHVEGDVLVLVTKIDPY